jgi:hypothetical protein
LAPEAFPAPGAIAEGFMDGKKPEPARSGDRLANRNESGASLVCISLL